MLLDNFSFAGRACGGGMARAADAADAGAASAAKGREEEEKKRRDIGTRIKPSKRRVETGNEPRKKMPASCVTKGNDDLPGVRATDAAAAITGTSGAGRAEDGTPSAVSLRFFSFCEYFEKNRNGKL